MLLMELIENMAGILEKTFTYLKEKLWDSNQSILGSIWAYVICLYHSISEPVSR
jgi:hypothetical protein